MRVSAVIPTCNNLEILKSCLYSISKNTDLQEAGMEVIVVANGCDDGTKDYVESLGEPFRLLSFPVPLGYVKSTNLGIVASRGEYVLLLNDDTCILDWGNNGSWLRMLTDPLDQDPDVAVTGSNKAAWTENKFWMVFFCAMTRRRLLLDVGLLDESFGMGYGEDLWYCLKVQEMGKKIRQVPVEHDCYASSFPIWHRGNMTFCRHEDQKDPGKLDARFPRTDKDRKFAEEYLRRGF